MGKSDTLRAPSRTILLPPRLSPAALRALFAELKDTAGEQSVILDLAQVKGLTPPLFEIIRSIEKAYANVSLENHPSLPSGEPAAASSDATPSELLSNADVPSHPVPRTALRSMRQSVDHFFLLLSDTLFHTVRYFRARETDGAGREYG